MRIAAAVALVIGLSAGALVGRIAAVNAADRAAIPTHHSAGTAALDNLDYFDGSQEDSLAHSYLALVSMGNSTGE
jgi:hypothetical protein